MGISMSWTRGHVSSNFIHFPFHNLSHLKYNFRQNPGKISTARGYILQNIHKDYSRSQLFSFFTN